MSYVRWLASTAIPHLIHPDVRRTVPAAGAWHYCEWQQEAGSGISQTSGRSTGSGIPVAATVANAGYSRGIEVYFNGVGIGAVRRVGVHLLLLVCGQSGNIEGDHGSGVCLARYIARDAAPPKEQPTLRHGTSHTHVKHAASPFFYVCD